MKCFALLIPLEKTFVSHVIDDENSCTCADAEDGEAPKLFSEEQKQDKDFLEETTINYGDSIAEHIADGRAVWLSVTVKLPF